MKLTTYVVLGAIATAMLYSYTVTPEASLNDDYYLEEFAKFIVKFNRHYDHDGEYVKRFQVFKMALIRIIEHNSMNHHRYQLGIN